MRTLQTWRLEQCSGEEVRGAVRPAELPRLGGAAPAGGTSQGRKVIQTSEQPNRGGAGEGRRRGAGEGEDGGVGEGTDLGGAPAGMTFLARRLAVGTTGGAGERVTTFLRGSVGAGERVTTGGDDLVDAVVAGGWSKWRAGNARLLLIPPARSAAAPVFGARSAAWPASARDFFARGAKFRGPRRSGPPTRRAARLRTASAPPPRRLAPPSAAYRPDAADPP